MLTREVHTVCSFLTSVVDILCIMWPLRLLEGVLWGKAGGKFAFSPLVELSDQWGLKTDHWCSRNSDSGRSHRVKLKRFFFFFISVFHGSRLRHVTHQPPITMVCRVKPAVWRKKKKSTDQCSRFFFSFSLLGFAIIIIILFFFHLHATRGLTKACVGWSLAHPSPAEEQQSSELMDSDVKKIIKE